MDGTGTAAQFHFPSQLAYLNGNLYVADSHNDAVRKIDVNTGAVSPFATVTNAYGIASDGTHFYVGDHTGDQVHVLDSDGGTSQTFADL